MHEASNVVAETLGIKTWLSVSWRCDIDVDLAGYLGNHAEPMDAKDIFKRVFITAQPIGNTEVTDAQLEQLRTAVEATCPVFLLFKSAGVAIHNQWVAAGELLPTNPPMAAGDTMERMGVSVLSRGFHSDVTASGHLVTLAEPVEDGGSGKGPNPMEALITAVAVCQLEQSLVIANEMSLGSWVVDADAAFVINLDGYLNLPHAQNMQAHDVFRSVKVDATVTADVDQDTVDRVLLQTLARCPLVRLLESAKVKVESKWSKA
jgi:uncharacterized OsmC-like protein